MASITDYMFDLSHVEEIYAYLFNTINIHATILDSEGSPILPNPESVPENWRTSRFFPLEFGEPMGGLQCMAADSDILDESAVHVRFCLHSILAILQREQEMRETSDEMLELSKQLTFLFGVARATIGVTKIEQLCRIILREISKAIGADCAFLHMTVEQEQKLEPALHNLSLEDLRDIEARDSFRQCSKDQTIIFSLEDGTSTLLSPIRGRDGQLGYLAFFRESSRSFFTSYEKKFVRIIESIISPTVQTIILYGNLQDLYLNTVKALAAAIDAKDEYTHGHSYRVAKYSMAIGKEMELEEKQLTDLEVAAYMHDLGKIGVEESILCKPDKLTKEEFESVKQHPVLTNRILTPIRLPDFIMEGAVMHHERLDGSGYPYGLRGDQIPLFARIIAVADVFDALTSTRPYRSAMTVEKALGVIREETYTCYDPKIVFALIASLANSESENELRDIFSGLCYVNIKSFNSFLVEFTKELLPPAKRTTRQLKE